VAPSISKKLALTLPTSSGRSVGMVPSWTKATELLFLLLLIFAPKNFGSFGIYRNMSSSAWAKQPYFGPQPPLEHSSRLRAIFTCLYFPTIFLQSKEVVNCASNARPGEPGLPAYIPSPPMTDWPSYTAVASDDRQGPHRNVAWYSFAVRSCKLPSSPKLKLKLKDHSLSAYSMRSAIWRTSHAAVTRAPLTSTPLIIRKLRRRLADMLLTSRVMLLLLESTWI
jgi:hypothetical protein